MIASTAVLLRIVVQLVQRDVDEHGPVVARGQAGDLRGRRSGVVGGGYRAYPWNVPDIGSGGGDRGADRGGRRVDPGDLAEHRVTDLALRVGRMESPCTDSSELRAGRRLDSPSNTLPLAKKPPAAMTSQTPTTIQRRRKHARPTAAIHPWLSCVLVFTRTACRVWMLQIHPERPRVDPGVNRSISLRDFSVRCIDRGEPAGPRQYEPSLGESCNRNRRP